MNDERLTSLLGSLRTERMDRVADDKIRTRLENAWTTRMERRSFTWNFRRFAPVLATLVLFAGLSAATMNAAGDSPLYSVRVAIEDAAIVLHPDPEDRAEYLVSLLDARQAEAARLESEGNAAAASKVRDAEQRTLRMVLASVPQAPEEAPVVAPTESPSPSPSPTPTATPTPTPVPTASPTPVVTQRPATVTPRPATPTPVRTPTPTAPPVATTPRPATPTPTSMLVKFIGNVKNPDFSLADGACVALSLPADFTAPCEIRTSQGAYNFFGSGRMNQTTTVYAWRYDPVAKVTYKGYVNVIIKGTSVQVPDIKLVKL